MAAWVRVRRAGVGEWSQPADKVLRDGEELIEGSEHEAPFRDFPDPADENRPLPEETPAPSGARGAKSPKGA